MKATDLMIGDWVKYTLTGIPARVAGIIKTSKECNIYAYVGTGNRLQGINERDFEPIDITYLPGVVVKWREVANA